MADLATQLTELYDRRSEVTPADLDAHALVNEAITLLDTGAARVAEFAADGTMVVNEWLKKAILLLFQLH